MSGRKKYVITAKCYDKRGRLISVGVNNYKKTHPTQAAIAEKVGLPDKQFLHAEICALLRAGDQKVHKILVERFDSNGQPANAEPCPVCKEAIRMWGVQYVEFTT